MVIGLSAVQFGLQSSFVTTSMITDRMGLHKVLLPINYKNYSLQEEKYSQVIWGKRKFGLKDWKKNKSFYGDWNRSCNRLI